MLFFVTIYRTRSLYSHRRRLARYIVMCLIILLTIPISAHSVSPDTEDDLLLMVIPAIVGAIPSYAGTYSGIMKYTMTYPGGSASGADIIVILINRDGTVVTGPDSPYPGTGTISGNTATAYYPAQNFNSPGVSCTGSVKGIGTISGDTIGGTLGPSTFYCNGIPFTMTGTFSATKN